MTTLLQLALSGFWSFIGSLILLTLFLQAAVCVPATLIFRCWNRWCRTRNIKAHGWPPAHCDADGDFRKEVKKTEPAAETP